MIVTGLKQIQDLEISKWGRFVVYLAEWHNYGASGTCVFSNRLAALKWVCREVLMYRPGGFENFPNPALQYPYEERDGMEKSELTPFFVALWEKGGATITKTEVCDHESAT